MNSTFFSAKGFLGKESEAFDAVELIHKEENGFGAVFAKADAGDKCFNEELAVAIKIEQPEEMEAFVSVNRYSTYWCRPNFGTDLKENPHDTQLLLMKNKDGSFTAILPVCGDKYKTVIEGDETGCYAKVFSWFDGLSTVDTLCFVYGTGKNPYTLVHDLTKYGVELLGNYINMREDRPYPEVFEYLGWCSWDAFQIRVTETDMISKCQEFKDKDIPVRWAIFDDMWGDVKNFVGKKYANGGEMFRLMHSSALDSFEAAPERFPHGLKYCIGKMKDEYDITTGMWHPTTGYWRGVTPEGEIYKNHPELFITRHIDGMDRLVPGTTKEQFAGFFDAFHTFLKDCGAKFMKVDNQTCISMWYKGIAPVGEIARNLHYGIETSLYKHFNGDLINCMGMGQENIWNRPKTAISRCSGDFQPENRAWFTNHILQCSYNSFYQGQLLWCDWDMWWTDDSQGIKNSVVRAVSGGPIYVSDTAKRSNASVLKPVCLYDGRILRCDVPGMPTADCLTMNPEEATDAFKIFSNTQDTYYVAAFDINKDNKKANVKICLDDFFAEPVSDKYVIKEHFTNLRTVVCKCCDYTYSSVLKDQDDFRLYTVAPVKDGFCYLGLCEKFIGGITAENITADGFTLREKGEFEFYSEKAVKNVLVDGKIAVIAKNGNFYKVKVSGEKRTAEVKIEY